MYQLTDKYSCYVTKDAKHFCVMNHLDNAVDGGYRIGIDRAQFIDDGIKYMVTVLEGDNLNNYKIDLQKAEG